LILDFLESCPVVHLQDVIRAEEHKEVPSDGHLLNSDVVFELEELTRAVGEVWVPSHASFLDIIYFVREEQLELEADNVLLGRVSSALIKSDDGVLLSNVSVPLLKLGSHQSEGSVAHLKLLGDDSHPHSVGMDIISTSEILLKLSIGSIVS